MPTRTYSRKTDSQGLPADPTWGDPSFSVGILAALPGRTWRTAAGSDVALDIDGTDLTQQEDDDLTTAHTAWVPIDTTRYADTFKVETISGGKIQKVEWFETDEGEGVYSGLARDEIYTWSGNSLTAKTSTTYYKDGSAVPGSVVAETYFTASGGRRVTKVTP